MSLSASALSGIARRVRREDEQGHASSSGVATFRYFVQSMVAVAGYKLAGAIVLRLVCCATDVGTLIWFLSRAELIGDGGVRSDMSRLAAEGWQSFFAPLFAAIVLRGLAAVGARTLGLDAAKRMAISQQQELSRTYLAEGADYTLLGPASPLSDAVAKLVPANTRALAVANDLIGLATAAFASVLVSPIMAVLSLALILALSAVRRQWRPLLARERSGRLRLRRLTTASAEEIIRARMIKLSNNAQARLLRRIERRLLEESGSAAGTLAGQAELYRGLLELLAWTGVLAYLAVGLEHFHTSLARELLLLALAAGMIHLLERLGSHLRNWSSLLKIIYAAAEAGRLRAPEVIPFAMPRGDLVLLRGMYLKGVPLREPGTRKPYGSVDIDINALGITAVVTHGVQGEGLAEILLGVEEAAAGTVFVDGTSLSGSVLRAWRDEVAHAPAEVVFLNDTLGANLRMTSSLARDGTLWGALAAAQLTSLAQRLPRGLKTVLDHRASSLTGGERHRLGLARAILRRPQLLVVEEDATNFSADDRLATETLLKGLKGRCTVVLITPRASTAHLADWVVTLVDGRSAEAGSFYSLAAKKGSVLAGLLALESA